MILVVSFSYIVLFSHVYVLLLNVYTLKYRIMK